MEGNLSSSSMMQRNSSYGGFDSQGGPGPVRAHHHHHQQHPLSHHPVQGSSMVNPTIHENFPLTIGSTQACDRTISLAEYNKLDNRKSASDEDEPSFNEDIASDLSKGKKAFTWHRVKWTDTMVRLLITAVSYITEEASNEYGGGLRRKYANLQKKGKWKSVSKVMAERGHFVSPQQCEDKFNDLNKRYKRLNEILGRGTSCEVVENPTLLDVMDQIPEKSKDEVRKILSSKHLHYEEMCSYHNGNHLHLPHDPELQRSLRLALRSRDDHDEVKKDTNDEVEHDSESDGHDESDENHGRFGFSGPASKRAKHFNSVDCNKGFNFNGDKNVDADLDKGEKTSVLSKEWMNHKKLQLEEQRIHIEVQMLELEKEKFKWQRFCRKKDRELEMMRMEIERVKLENERMALELRQKELGIDNN